MRTVKLGLPFPGAFRFATWLAIPELELYRS